MKNLKKKDSIASKRRRRIFKNSLRKKRMMFGIIYSPKNTTQFLIKYHNNFRNNCFDDEDFIPFGSMINGYDSQSQNSTFDEEDEEKNLFCY